jgi:hypothetical protein
MFVLSFLPLSTSNTKQLNGSEEDIDLHINQNDNITLDITNEIEIELFIEQDKEIVL